MTADNRTNSESKIRQNDAKHFAWSEAQVDAAAKIIRRASLETTANPGDFWSDCYEGEREAWRNAARAALVAAAGAAPQAESVPVSTYISPHLPSMIRNLWKSDPSEKSVRTALGLAGDLIQELIHLRATSAVQQVSESDAIALVEEVIAIHADRIGTHYEDCYKYHVACLAVAVKRRLAGKEKNDE